MLGPEPKVCRAGTAVGEPERMKDGEKTDKKAGR